MKRFLDKHLERLLLLATVLAVAAGVVAVASGDGKGEARRAGGELPTCRAAGFAGDSTREGTCRTRTTQLTVVNKGTSLHLGPLRVGVRDTNVVEPRSDRGRNAGRARVEVSVTLLNSGSEPLNLSAGPAALYLHLRANRVHVDRAAMSQEGVLDLRKPLGPGERREGKLRFELSDAAGTSAVAGATAELGIRLEEDGPVGVIRIFVQPSAG